MNNTGAGWYRWEHADLILKLRVQPRARRDALVGPHGDRFRVRVTAPPVEGRANPHLIRLFTKAFGVRSAVTSLCAPGRRAATSASEFPHHARFRDG